jgi:hypothetical protein
VSLQSPAHTTSRDVNIATGGVRCRAVGKPSRTVTCFIILGGREDESAMTEIDGTNIGCSTSASWRLKWGREGGAVYKLIEQDGMSGLY